MTTDEEIAVEDYRNGGYGPAADYYRLLSNPFWTPPMSDGEYNDHLDHMSRMERARSDY